MSASSWTRRRSRCAYIREARLGHSVALNAGIAAARGELIAFTDDDALPYPDWLRQLERAFAEYGAHIVFGKAIPHWDNGAPSWFSPRFNPNFALMDYGPRPFVATSTETPFFGVNHATRREALAELGGFREDMGLFGVKGGIGNDVDLMERALAAGMRIAYNPDCVVRHIIREARCRKIHHRKVAWSAGEFYYVWLRATVQNVPYLFGLPRYMHRLALGTLGSYLAALVRRRRDETFYYELRLIRYLGLCWQSCRWRFRRQALERPAGAERPVAQPAQSS